MRYNFVIREHEEFGTLGLQLKDCPGMDPLPGLGTAHDIVEHFPKGNDSIKDEFLALGASLYVRGDTGHYQANGNTNSPGQHIASDMSNIFGHYAYESYQFPPYVKTKKLDSDWIEEEIDKCISAFREELEYEKDLADHMPANWQKILQSYLRLGYRKAAKRWGDAYIALSLFCHIEQNVEKILRNYQEDTEVSIFLVKKTQTVKILVNEYGEKTFL